MSTAASERSVFLNVPFDSDYEECFLALIAGLTGLGLKPRSVLEVTPGKDRLQRIYRLLRSCRYSLHDLSRVELSAGHPRFNMPFEAGLATALALDRRGHDRFGAARSARARRPRPVASAPARSARRQRSAPKP